MVHLMKKSETVPLDGRIHKLIHSFFPDHSLSLT